MRLAARRPVFHSEADFQFALAWQIHTDHPAAHIRLEKRPLPEENLRLDLHVDLDGYRVAVECKYMVRELDVTVAGEWFALRKQGAHDVRRYDTLKDVARVVAGRLAWADGTGSGTMRSREAAIELDGSYRINWRDFATPAHGPAGRFRYLLIKVHLGYDLLGPFT